MRLAGLLIIRDERRRRWRAARRELRRAGALGFVDVLAFRAYARLFLAGRDDAWKRGAVARLQRTWPADLDAVPQLVVSTPNSAEAREFIARLQPDIVIARCKVILRRDVFQLARVGTFVLHPGICPEYRNAHGCFWALANRDLTRVGMTLLRVDAGIDTGPVYLHGTCEYDECADSHTVIQYRAVLDNLEAIGRTLIALHRGDAVTPVPTAHRRSAEWGQPQLTKYLRWKWGARRLRRTRRTEIQIRAGAPRHEVQGGASETSGDMWGRFREADPVEPPAQRDAWAGFREADPAAKQPEVLH